MLKTRRRRELESSKTGMEAPPQILGLSLGNHDQGRLCNISVKLITRTSIQESRYLLIQTNKQNVFRKYVARNIVACNFYTICVLQV